MLWMIHVVTIPVLREGPLPMGDISRYECVPVIPYMYDTLQRSNYRYTHDYGRFFDSVLCLRVSFFVIRVSIWRTGFGGPSMLQPHHLCRPRTPARGQIRLDILDTFICVWSPSACGPVAPRSRRRALYLSLYYRTDRCESRGYDHYARK